MEFRISALSDIGTTRERNQDAFLVEEANTSQGKVLLAVVCDGMGGFQNGEQASATVIYAFQEWFHNTFPKMTNGPLDINEIRTSWDKLIYSENKRISEHAQSLKIQMGTTVVAMLVTPAFYLIVNVGDSRLYLLDKDIYQVTKDHTLVQKEIDAGLYKAEDAEKHPKKNSLLQCVGASMNIVPDYYTARPEAGTMILLCSDGFRHKVTNPELYSYLKPANNPNESIMKSNLQAVTTMVMDRGERDNITSVLVGIA